MSTNTSPKRKSTSSTPPSEEEHVSKKQAVSNPPPLTALPPPLMPYPPGHFVQMVHPQQPYYHMYPQAPIYLPLSPQQHPTSISPPLSTNENPSSGKTSCLLPKKSNTNTASSPLSSPARTIYPQPPPSPFYHPYPVQMSPPAMLPIGRHGSISSPSGLASTADQREKARKVSHSAIERRRRERINDKIIQLKELIPSCAEQDNLHKMSILQSAIDYITYLKEIVSKFEDETSPSLLKGDHLKVKTTKSMLPKEVEKFTSQFSVQTIQRVPEEESRKDEEEDEEEDEDEQDISSPVRKSLKPKDIIRSGTPLVSTPRPLTPPHEEEPMSTEPIYKKQSEETIDSEKLLMTPKPDEVKHMSLQNILC